MLMHNSRRRVANQPKVEAPAPASEGQRRLPRQTATPPAPQVDKGDTAWILTSAALVLMMTIPGLFLFYGGLVRGKNVLGTIMQSFVIVALISLQWVLFGYSLAFGPDIIESSAVSHGSGSTVLARSRTPTMPRPFPISLSWHTR